MLIWLIRHAEAASADSRTSDFQRPLTAHGRARFGELIAAIDWTGTRLEKIAHSPRERAVQTAQLLAQHVGAGLSSCDWLSQTFAPEQLTAWLNRHVAERVAIVGHEPSMSRAAEYLTGCHRLRFSPGTIACVELSGSTEFGSGRLHWLVSPGILRSAP